MHMIRPLIFPLISHMMNQVCLYIIQVFCKSLRSSSTDLTFEPPCVTAVLKAAFDTHLAVRTIASIALWEWNLVNRKLDCPQGLALSFKQPLRCDTLLCPCVKKKQLDIKPLCASLRSSMFYSASATDNGAILFYPPRMHFG